MTLGVGRLAPGAVLDGRFRLEHQIGRGGHATVYEAVELKSGTRVAVKVVDSADLCEPVLNRFLREAKIIARLAHPGIVKVLGSGQDDAGHPYLAMERLEGQTLEGWLDASVVEKRDEVFFRAVASMLAQVARALHAAHAVGVVHRDVKPGNVFLCQARDTSSAVKLLDFGIAKDERLEATRMTKTGDLVGTLEYVSREQLEGRADFRSDIYSLGIVLFEALCGTTPFRAVGSLAVLDRMNATKGAVPDPRKTNPEAPAGLARICLKATDMDPLARYDSAEGFAEELERWLDVGDAESTPGTGQHGRITKRAALLVGAACAVLLLTTLWTTRESALPAPIPARTAAFTFPGLKPWTPGQLRIDLFGPTRLPGSKPRPDNGIGPAAIHAEPTPPPPPAEATEVETVSPEQVRAALASRDYARAEELCRSALEEDPGRGWAHHGRATVALAQGRYAAAAEALEQAVEAEPKRVDYRAQLGRVLERLGRAPQAKEQWRAVLALEPNNQQAQAQLGQERGSAER